MINFDYITKKKQDKKHKAICLKIFDHPYRILIIGSSGSGKTNVLVYSKN